MSPDELLHLGTLLVEKAQERGLVLRMYGGVAVYARCESITSHPRLQHIHTDIDFVAPTDDWDALVESFRSRGLEVKTRSKARLILSKGDVEVDIRSPFWQHPYSIDLSPRLSLDKTTLPLADLLLLKLQRFGFKEMEKQDSIALLLDHRVASGGDSETIDRDYIYRLTNRNWALWTTVFDNTVTLEKILNDYLEPEEAQLVWRRIELLQEVMDGKAKSLGWWLRWIPNRRLRWYAEQGLEGTNERKAKPRINSG